MICRSLWPWIMATHITWLVCEAWVIFWLKVCGNVLWKSFRNFFFCSFYDQHNRTCDQAICAVKDCFCTNYHFSIQKHWTRTRIVPIERDILIFLLNVGVIKNIPKCQFTVVLSNFHLGGFCQIIKVILKFSLDILIHIIKDKNNLLFNNELHEL